MSKFSVDFVDGFLPAEKQQLPFGDLLFELFLSSKVNDLSIHCPNVIRFIEILLTDDIRKILKEVTSENKEEAWRLYANKQHIIQECMEMDNHSARKTIGLLKIAALYHDIGKYIRRENHPQIGVNLLRNLNDESRAALVNGLEWMQIGTTDKPESRTHRFTLLCSILQHHDKFGVVSTGEGSLPLFGDILYYTSDVSALAGIKKNITAVMLLNLADAAAVCTADQTERLEATKLVKMILENRGKKNVDIELQRLFEIWESPNNYLGLRLRKVKTFIADWEILINGVEHESVNGNRTRLKDYLIKIEQNPDRTIQRILRLINECCYVTNAINLIEHIDPTGIESVLVGALGSHQFQKFCETIALIVKMDYSLNFFKAIVCSTIRKELDKNYMLKNEKNWAILTPTDQTNLSNLSRKQLQDIVTKVAVLFVKVIHGIILRYSSVLECSSSNPYRFGLQMRDLTNDDNIRESILNFLCINESREHVALTWIADEVTIWSMD